MPTEKPRYCITVDDETLKEIDDFRFENRYNSRSKATLEFIRMGLESLKTNEKNNLEKYKNPHKKTGCNLQPVFYIDYQ